MKKQLYLANHGFFGKATTLNQIDHKLLAILYKIEQDGFKTAIQQKWFIFDNEQNIYETGSRLMSEEIKLVPFKNGYCVLGSQKQSFIKRDVIPLDSFIKQMESGVSDFKLSFEEALKELEIAIDFTKARIEMGWTQQTLAKKAKVSQGSVAHMESGRNMSIKTLYKLAAALNKQLIIKIESK